MLEKGERSRYISLTFLTCGRDWIARGLRSAPRISGEPFPHLPAEVGNGHSHHRSWRCTHPVCCLQLLQDGGPLPGPGSVLLSNTGNELSEETHVLPKQETLLGRGARVREPGELLCRVACCLKFCGDGISFLVVSGQSCWFRVLPGGAHIAQPRWIPVRRILEGGRAHGIYFGPFLNSSGWLWLVSSPFLTRTSCL